MLVKDLNLYRRSFNKYFLKGIIKGNKCKIALIRADQISLKLVTIRANIQLNLSAQEEKDVLNSCETFLISINAFEPNRLFKRNAEGKLVLKKTWEMIQEERITMDEESRG